ncbi:MAG: GNAT family N-acetyltransferase [Oscillospiraceae bacterium]
MYCANGILEKLKPLFEFAAEDLTIPSILAGKCGNAYCDNMDNPRSAVLAIDDYYYLAGETTIIDSLLKLVGNNDKAIFVPDNEDTWYKALSRCGKKLIKCERKRTVIPKKFDTKALEEIKEKEKNFPEIELMPIDENLYDEALKEKWSVPLVGNFKNYNDFKDNGFGFILSKEGRIIAGTSIFSYLNDDVDIEVTTREGYRGQGLAQITSAAFILECLKRGVVPHWDARNDASLAIAKHMGFEYEKSYMSFEFEG